MYMLLDTTVFTSDPQFRQGFWQLVGARPDSWDLHVAASWAVVQEAVGNRRRLLHEHRSKLHGVVMDLQRQGVVVDLSVLSVVDQEVEGYEEWFNQQLIKFKVDVIEDDDFDHRQLVSRAVARRRPCDSSGNGYRDTLNWFTVLGIARSNPTQQVVWVSNDSDFAEPKDRTVLHADLQYDLTELGALDRVHLSCELKSALEYISTEFQIAAPKGVWAALQLQISQAVVLELNDESARRLLDVVECGLPRLFSSAEAVLEGAEHIGSAIVENLGDDASVLPFEVRFKASCRLRQYNRSDGELEDVLSEDGLIEKELIASGTVRIERKPYAVTDVVVNSVAGPEDDPQVIANRDEIRRIRAFAKTLTDYNDLMVQSLPGTGVQSFAKTLVDYNTSLATSLSGSSELQGIAKKLLDYSTSMRKPLSESEMQGTAKTLVDYNSSMSRSIPSASEVKGVVKVVDAFNKARRRQRPS